MSLVVQPNSVVLHSTLSGQYKFPIPLEDVATSCLFKLLVWSSYGATAV